MLSERRQISGSCAKKFIALTHTSAADVCCCIFLPLQSARASLPACHCFFLPLLLCCERACVARYLSGSSVFYGMRAISYCCKSQQPLPAIACACCAVINAMPGDRRVAYVCLSRRRTLGYAALRQFSCLLLPPSCLARLPRLSKNWCGKAHYVEIQPRKHKDKIEKQ